MTDRIPIFELPLALVPGEQVPLHVFEPRYRRMLDHCLREGRSFGILTAGDEGPSELGCTARVVEVLERFEDGRSNIVVVGERVFRREGELSEPPDRWPEADVELLSDDGAPADPAPAREAFLDLAEEATGERPDPESVEDLDSYGLAGRVELPVETKQSLLGLRSEADRVQLLEKTFAELTESIERAEQIRALAQTNGKVRFGR